MAKQHYLKIKETLDSLNGLKDSMIKKVSRWEVRSDEDKKELFVMKQQAAQDLQKLLSFCDNQISLS